MISAHSMDDPAAEDRGAHRECQVAWTKGAGHSEVAELVGTSPLRITGDLDTACIDSGVEVLVTKRFPKSDLVSSVIPVGFDADAIASVAVAVGEGPHSPYAVEIAERVARSLGVDGTVITAYTTSNKEPDAQALLGRVVPNTSTFQSEAIQTAKPRSITEQLSKDTLLVHGAAGGSFIERHLTGTGTRLTSRARGGVLVVRSAPRRCFHAATSPTAFALAPELLVADALQLMTKPFAPVVKDRKLLGIVRIETLITADPRVAIEASIEPVAGLGHVDPLRLVAFERDRLGPGPLPVVDGANRLVGVIET